MGYESGVMSSRAFSFDKGFGHLSRAFFYAPHFKTNSHNVAIDLLWDL